MDFSIATLSASGIDAAAAGATGSTTGWLAAMAANPNNTSYNKNQTECKVRFNHNNVDQAEFYQ
jgi:hypothetical protein